MQSENNTMVAQKLDEIASSDQRNRSATRLLWRNMLAAQEDCTSMIQRYYQQNIAQLLALYNNVEDLRTHVQIMVESAAPRIAQKPEARTPNISTGNNINEVGGIQTCGEAFLLLYETRLLLGRFALMPHLHKYSAPDSLIPGIIYSNVSSMIILRSNSDRDANQ